MLKSPAFLPSAGDEQFDQGTHRMIRLTHDPIDPAGLTQLVRSPAAGAVVLFLGTVREMTAGRQTALLEYDAYPAMAEAQLAALDAEARARWPIVEAAIVHRLGRLDLGEISVAVVVSTPHRDQAFDAARFLIDRLKQVVPIWKKEHFSDGRTEWVHPGLPAEEQPPRSGADAERSDTL